MRRFKTLALAALVGAGVIVPLFGDPRSSPVSHAEWARLLLRALELNDTVALSSQAGQAFSVLSWKSSLAYPGDRFMRADGVEVVKEGDVRRIVARAELAEASYSLSVVRQGDYRLRVKIAGDPANPAEAELMRFGSTDPMRSYTVVPSSVEAWLDVGTMHLDPGTYTASFSLPQGSSLANVEIAPPCLTPVEPTGGWRAAAITQTEDIAVTALRAIDQEHELPLADAPFEFTAGDFQADESVKSAAESGDEPAAAGMWLKSGEQGAQAILFVDVPEDGIYSLSQLSLNTGGTSWMADACRKAVVCPKEDEGQSRLEWNPVMTAPFTKGRHFFSVTLGKDSKIARVRFERKKDGPQDYLGTLRRLGFDPGPSGQAVGRNKAVDAMNWIQEHNPLRGQRAFCGEIEVPSRLIATGEQPAPPVAQAQTANPPAGGGPPPFEPIPIVLPSPEFPSPPPPPTPPPSPSPSPTPTPCQPPATTTVPNPCPS